MTTSYTLKFTISELMDSIVKWGSLDFNTEEIGFETLSALTLSTTNFIRQWRYSPLYRTNIRLLRMAFVWTRFFEFEEEAAGETNLNPDRTRTARFGGVAFLTVQDYTQQIDVNRVNLRNGFVVGNFGRFRVFADNNGQPLPGVEADDNSFEDSGTGADPDDPDAPMGEQPVRRVPLRFNPEVPLTPDELAAMIARNAATAQRIDTFKTQLKIEQQGGSS